MPFSPRPKRERKGRGSVGRRNIVSPDDSVTSYAPKKSLKKASDKTYANSI